MTVPVRSHAGGAKPTALSGPITPTALSFTVTAGGGTGWPDGTLGEFIVCVDQGLSGEEKILCSSRAVDTFTVATGGRGYDGTAQSSHANLAVVTHVYGAVEAGEANAHITDTTRDDHTQYLTAARGDALFLTQTEGDARYQPLGSGLVGVRAFRAAVSGDYPVLSGVSTAIPLTGESFDTSNFHDLVLNPSRVTIPAGVAQVDVVAGVTFDISGAGSSRRCEIRLNGAFVFGSDSGNAGAGEATYAHATMPALDVVAGDYLEVWAKQDSGGSLNVLAQPTYTWLSVRKIG